MSGGGADHKKAEGAEGGAKGHNWLTNKLNNLGKWSWEKIKGIKNGTRNRVYKTLGSAVSGVGYVKNELGIASKEKGLLSPIAGISKSIRERILGTGWFGKIIGFPLMVGEAALRTVDRVGYSLATGKSLDNGSSTGGHAPTHAAEDHGDHGDHPAEHAA